MTRAGTAVLIASLLLAACGGDSDDPPQPDHSGNFVGRWDGTSNMTMVGQSSTASGVYAPITRVGANKVNVGGFCDDFSGPNADVTSSTSFRMAALSCPPIVAGACPAVTLSVNAGGTGTLASGQLTMSVTGSATGCAQSYPYTLTFSGSRTSTDPQALTIELGILSAAVQAELARRF